MIEEVTVDISGKTYSATMEGNHLEIKQDILKILNNNLNSPYYYRVLIDIERK